MEHFRDRGSCGDVWMSDHRFDSMMISPPYDGQGLISDLLSCLYRSLNPNHFQSRKYSRLDLAGEIRNKLNYRMKGMEWD
jgi:hypothetical protein